jgi:hypothetical protein
MVTRYHQIREFAVKALDIVRLELATAREVALTLHGVGYGLDEVEAFRSELAGIFDAIRAGRVSGNLRQITVVESDSRRADTMRKVLVQLVPVYPGQAAGTTVRSLIGTLAPFDRVGFDSDSRRHAFVAQPYSASFEDVYHYAIAPSVRKVGLLCERLDQQPFTGAVLDQMKERIAAATVVVADLSGANANVYLEVGFAWGRGIPTVLVCNAKTKMLFDVRGQRYLSYSSIKDLEGLLTGELSRLVELGSP